MFLIQIGQAGAQVGTQAEKNSESNNHFGNMKKQITLGMLGVAAMAEDAIKYQTTGFGPVNLPSYPQADLNTLYASTTDTHATDKNELHTIANAQVSSRATSTRSIDSLFTRVPSSHELDELVNGADSVGLLQTVQTLVSNDAIPCGQALNYLLELLGRIRAAIQKKQFGADQLKVIIDAAKVEIARLNKEIQNREQAITDLWLDELNDKLAHVLNDLQDYYNKFNFIEAQIAPNEAKVAGFQKEIENFRKSNDEERNRIANDRLKLTAAENQIRELKRQLALAEERKAYLESSIESSLALIARNDAGIDAAQKSIDDLEAEIRRLRDQADTLRAKTRSLEIQVERLRTDINVAEAKEARLREEIRDLQDRINLEEKKLATDDLNKLNEQINILKNSLPGIEEEVNRQYFNCYGEGAVTVAHTGDTVVYIVKGERFPELLQNTYGIKAETGKGGLRGKQDDYHFYCVDIFSEPYVKEVGYPFPEEKKKPYVPEKVTKFENDFDCTNQEGISGKGVIVGVSGNRYEIQAFTNQKAHKYYIEVGACTVIMSTVKVPKEGMQIAYTGNDSHGVVQAGMITVW